MTEPGPKGAPLSPAAPAAREASAGGIDGIPSLDYQGLLERLPAGVVVHGPDSALRYANRQACALLGMTLEQMMGKQARDPAWRFVRDDGSPMPLSEYPVQRVLDTREAIREQVVGIEHSGQSVRRWVLVNAFPDLEEEGLRQVVVTFSDLTARKEMESELGKRKASLRASEARYRNLFEAGSDALFLIDNASGQILDANEAAASLYDYSREELLKLKNTDLSAEPEQTAAATRPPEIPPGHRVTIPGRRHRRRGGTVFPVDITARFFDFEGQTVHLASIRDATDRLRAEALLRSSEAKFSAAFHASPDSVAITRADDGRILEVNEGFTRVFEYSREEAIGRTTAELAVWADPKDRERMMAALGAEGRIRDLAAVGRARSGRLFDGEVTSAFIDLHGIPHLLTIIRDVTERSQAEAERRKLEASLARTDRLSSMGTLAAGVAHEINNPLTFVLFNLESLANEIQQKAKAVTRTWQRLEDHLGEGPLREVLGPDPDAFDPKAWAELEDLYQSGLEGGRRIRDIVRGLGTFSRVDDDALTSVDLKTPIDAALNMAANEIKHRARLIRELAPTPPVLANEGRLSQVFLNLLINAAHAIEEGDAENNTLQVRTWQEGDSVFAEVEDTGTGMAAEQLEQIFEPFFTTKGIGVGSGLGLSIVRNIVTEFGGEIEVSSKLGRGSRFQLRFPAAARATESPRPGASPESAPGEARGRLLLIDDEAQIRHALKRILSKHEVIEADGGEQARDILEGDRAFDLILSDVMMPKMSGIELHQWLETNHPALARRVVFVSGGAFTPQAQSYLEGVENTQLEKPFDVQRVRQVIQDLLREGTEES